MEEVDLGKLVCTSFQTCGLLPYNAETMQLRARAHSKHFDYLFKSTNHLLCLIVSHAE